MSEYWVSKKKYYCRYCEIYIADDVPSRSQHENGLRHKGNKDRFIRGLYKAGVKKKIEGEEEKREMKRVEQAAQEAYARDVGAGHASASGSSSSAAATASTSAAPKPRPPPPPKPSDPYVNYTTAASLGISDPDVDRLVEEAKLRRSEGRAGDWVAVVPPPPPPIPEAGDVAAAGMKSEQEDKENVGEVRKRERVVEEPVDEDDTRRFKMMKKTAAVGLGEIYDPGVIRVKPRVERAGGGGESLTAVSEATVKVAVPPATGPVLGGDFVLQLRGNGSGGVEARDAAPVLGATEKPEWKSRGWRRAGMGLDAVGDAGDAAAVDEENKPVDSLAGEMAHVDGPSGVSSKEVKKEDTYTDAAEAVPDVDEKTVKGEPADAEDKTLLSVDLTPTGSLFRKRKVPVGSSRGRVRRHV